MASSPSSPLLGIRDHQAPFNVEKILNTINNLVRVLKLTLMLNLSPAPLPPTPPPTATVILSKATTLKSGLDLVSPQSASELHSKVLTDCIASITKWAASVSHQPTPSPSPCKAKASTPSRSPPKATAFSLPDITTTQPMAKPSKAQPYKAIKGSPTPTRLPSASPFACPAYFSARPTNLGITHPFSNLGITHPIPPISPASLSAAPHLGITYPASPFACLASCSAGPTNLSITYPNPPISPNALSAAPANLGITYRPRKVCKVKPSTKAAWPAFYSTASANLGITHPISTHLISPISPAALLAAPANLGLTYPEPNKRSVATHYFIKAVRTTMSLGWR